MSAAGASNDSPSHAEQHRGALEELIRVYWFPLYAFLRRKGNTRQAAEDLTQGFFTHLLEKRSLASVDPAKGKFRTFLLTALTHFIADEHDRANALKRGGNRVIISLDCADAEARYNREPIDTLTPQRLYERSWALAVLNQVLQRLEQDYIRRGKSAEFTALRHVLDGQSSEITAAKIGQQLGMSEQAVRVATHRLRRRYRELLREQIMQTVGQADKVDDEIRYLLSCL